MTIPERAPRVGTRRRSLFRAALLATLGLAGCATVTDPDPSPLFDGRYVGSRRSNLPDACDLPVATGRTSATVSRGRLRMQLFGPDTRLDGTVGEDGVVRASGFWKHPRGFSNITVLHGRIAGGALSGTATDMRCETEVNLRRVGRR